MNLLINNHGDKSRSFVFIWLVECWIDLQDQSFLTIMPRMFTLPADTRLDNTFISAPLKICFEWLSLIILSNEHLSV